MPNLNLDITGDCSGAVAALGLTERAIASVQSRAGTGLGLAVSVDGARAATSDLGAVTRAATATTAAAQGLAANGSIAAGLGVGAAAAGRLTSALGGSARALGEVGASADSLSGAGVMVAGMTSRVSALGRAAGEVSAMSMLPGGGTASIAAATAAIDNHRVALAAQQLEMARGVPVMAAANAETRAMAGNTRELTGAAQSLNRVGGAPSIPGRWGANGDRIGSGAVISDAGRGSAPIIPGRWGANGERVGSGAFTPPPIVPRPPGGGGGGGGEGGDGDAEGVGRATATGKVISGLGAALVGSYAVGVAANATVAKYAIDAANKTIANTPQLAQESKDAMDQFGMGLQSVTKNAEGLAAVAPAFHVLGDAQDQLGKTTGAIGLKLLPTQIAAQTSQANALNAAYLRMEPAMGPSITAATSLGNALLAGVSSPSVVNGVKAVAESLAKPEVAAGITSLTAGVTTLGLIGTKVLTDVGTGIAKVTGIPTEASSPALLAGLGTAAMSKGLAGKLGFGGLAALATATAQQQEANGQDALVTPTILNTALGALAAGSVTGFNPLAMAAGGALANQATAQSPQLPGGGVGVPGMIGALTGAMGIGGMLGGAPGALAALPIVGAAAAGQAGLEATFGKGTPGPADDIIRLIGLGPQLDALNGVPTDGGAPPAQAPRGLPTSAQVNQTPYSGQSRQFVDFTPTPTESTTPAQPAAPPPPPPKPIVSAPVAPKAQIEPLQQTGNAANFAAAATAQLQQSAMTAATSVQALSMTMPPVAQAVQAVAPQVQPMQQTLANFPQQAATQMGTAAAAVSNGATQMGAEVPRAMSQGIAKQTPAACDAAAQLGASAVACAASALKSSSPSRKFIALGESTGEGLGIGVDNSAPGAVSSVGNMMGSIATLVGSMGSGVQAASDGVLPMAQNGGLMVGYVWARSVATGVDTVLASADFASIAMPKINSALAKTALGDLGLLGPAGAGASITKTAGGGVITMQAPAPVVNATILVSVEGTPMQVIAQNVVDASMSNLADSIDRQRG